MSATGRSNVRDLDDAYFTPAWCVRRLLEACPLPNHGPWLEPCAGDGAIIRAVTSYASAPMPRPYSEVKWTAIEIRDVDRPSGLAMNTIWRRGQNFLTLPDAEIDLHYTVAITNPPYRHALEFIERCRDLADTTVMLLRLNYLASAKRAEFMRANPPDVYVLPNRPSFTGGGKTDCTEYAWMVWPRVGRRRSFGEVRVLATTPRDERCKR